MDRRRDSWWRVPPFQPGERDVRIDRDGWVYWVRAVKQGLRSDFDGGAIDVVGFVVGLVVRVFINSWHDRERTWKVGVVRYRNSTWGGRVRLVFKEVLPAGVGPEERVESLVGQVGRGEFD